MVARMADAHGPRCALGITAAEIQIAAGVDREVAEWLQLTRGHVDRQSLRDGPEIENQRTMEHDRLTAGVQVDVSIADGAARIDCRFDEPACAMFAVEA